MFSCELCEISKNTFFSEHLRATASDPKWMCIETSPDYILTIAASYFIWKKITCVGNFPKSVTKLHFAVEYKILKSFLQQKFSLNDNSQLK